MQGIDPIGQRPFIRIAAALKIGASPQLPEKRRMTLQPFKTTASTVLLLAALAGHALAQGSAPVATQEITRAGTQASTAGPEEYFTGRVRVDPVWAADAHIHTSGAWVTFEPGARSAWHTHPAGQRLVVLSGVGLTQEWGKPLQVIRPGDVVACPPGVKHWHGAGPTTAMTHLAVTGSAGGKNVTWMEKVSDEQYNAR
jgi:quercetin dioxygenase-like cupin family protein